MTEPGSIVQPATGWWPRTERIGVTSSSYWWDVDVLGTDLPALAAIGTLSAQMGVGFEKTLSATGTLSATATKPILFDAAGAGYAGTNVNSTWAHTIAANANCVVTIASLSVPDNPPTVEAKVGTTTMDLLGSLYIDTGSARYLFLYIFGLLSPPTGAQTMHLNTTSASTRTAVNSLSYKSVNSFGTFQTNGPISSSSPTHDVSSTGATVQAFSNFQYTYTLYNSNQRFLYEYVLASNPSIVAGDDLAFGDATYTATQSNSALWGSVAVPLVPQ